MIRKEDLRAIVREQAAVQASREKIIPRKSLEKVTPVSKQALIITGIRRSGKSTFLKQVMGKWPPGYFMTFEDLRLSGFEQDDFIRLDEVLKEEFGQRDFYFFDEIQDVPGWEIFVRGKLDKKKHCVITGSNAGLLSRELGTHLTGRHLDWELFPFTYPEYLEYAGTGDSLEEFARYLTGGGFPEYLQSRRPEYLQNLLTDILIRDIAVREGIRNVRVLKELAVYLLSNLGREFSYHSLRRTFNIGAASTVSDYISFFENTYLFFTIPRFDYSLKKQARNPRKIYSIDNGLAVANSLSFSADHGRMFENLVYGALRRRYREIYYFRGRNECDFIVRDRGKIILIIQACFSLNSDNRNREFDGLMEAMKFFKSREGLILTMDEDDDLKIDGLRIIIQPARKWLLNQ